MEKYRKGGMFMNEEKRPFYKKWWFILIVILFISAGIGGLLDDGNESVEVNKNQEEEQPEKGEKKEETDLEIELEVTETIIDDENVIVRGTTNLIDGAVLAYQLRATQDDVVVENGKWEVTHSKEELDKDDENNAYGDGTELNFFIEFPTFAKQPEHVIEAYGEYGEKIKDGPNLLDDGETKSVSVRVNFDKEGIIDKKSAFEKAVQEWEKTVSDQMHDHYGEYGVLSIQMTPGSNWDVVNVYVPNEFKLLSEEEKRYWVEEVGPLLEADLTEHFKKDHTVHVYFKYEDGTDMATRKMLGGWKIK